MISNHQSPVVGEAPAAAPSPQSAMPVAGSWARLRDRSPWLQAFPAAWVPVRTLMPHNCAGTRGESAWDLDHRRCTSLQLKQLAEVLEKAGKGVARLILEGLMTGHPVAIGAGHFAFVEDFTAKKRCAWQEFTVPAKGGK